jgi:hypothetical protein
MRGKGARVAPVPVEAEPLGYRRRATDLEEFAGQTDHERDDLALGRVDRAVGPVMRVRAGGAGQLGPVHLIQCVHGRQRCRFSREGGAGDPADDRLHQRVVLRRRVSGVGQVAVALAHERRRLRDGRPASRSQPT